MKVQESFVITEPRERLWDFFEQVEQVARCVPGVELVEQIDDDNSKVRVTQAVGPMRATFDLKMRVTDRRPQDQMTFTAIGRAVKGAAGNIRSVNTVHLEPVDSGTRVSVDADMALGGVLGSVGQKVVAKQAAQVTKSFSEALERAIKGEEALAVAPAQTTAAPRAPAVTPAPPTAAPAAARAADLRDPALLAGLGVGFGIGVGFGATLVALAVRRLARP